MTSEAAVRVAMVGCGLIGKKRAQNLAGAKLVACADLNLERAEALARSIPDCEATADWKAVIGRPDVDIVIVATTNNALAQVSRRAIAAGKHVLVEKPGGLSTAELHPLVHLAQEMEVQVRVGFNHRYHAALLKAHELCRSGVLGELMYLRGRYGHGGRVGYEKEWRADPRLSGGGELMDQGVHLIDLSRVFLGEFTDVQGKAHTYFWDMPVDDNAFLLLQTQKGQAAFLHVSCTEWKNLFSLEIYGRNGKLHVEGLGGSYGLERLAFYRMLPEMGPPETTIWEFPREDASWQVEFSLFLEDIRQKRQPEAGLPDAIAALSVVEKIYRDSEYDHHS